MYRSLGSIILLSLVLLAGCSSVSTTGPGSRPAPPAPDARAQYLLGRGDYRGAAQEYFHLARAAKPLQNQMYYLTGIELLVRANQTEEAKRHLIALAPQVRDSQLQSRVHLAYAEIEIAEGKADQALQRLTALPLAGLGLEQRRSYYQLAALALETQGQLLEAVRMRAALDPLLDNGRDASYNQQSLWQDLLKLTPAELSQAAQTNPDPTLRGWFELGLLGKTLGAQHLAASLPDWRARFPGHPAERGLLAEFRQGVASPGGLALPGLSGPGMGGGQTHIALLLPLSGSLKSGGESIRDGFLAARYLDNGSDVQVYDTHAGNVVNVYAQALQQGASIVVGPLQKDALHALVAAYPRLPVPTLALNTLDTTGGQSLPNLYQYSLSPEDEASNVADWAWSDGHRSAAVLVPEGEWGMRLMQAFSQRWQQLGGQMLDYRTYKEPDFAAPVKQILSHKSYLNMVFIAGYPRQGRQIRPQFRYFMASNLPLYATSHLNSGLLEPGANADLNSVRVVETPWLLRDPALGQVLHSDGGLYASLSGAWDTATAATQKRLVAFGIDAFRITRAMHLLQNPASFSLRGETGDLYLDAQGVIHRQLQRAWFNRGKLELVDALAAPLDPEALPSADLNRP